MREFCRTLCGMVHDGKSDDDINSSIDDMTEQVYWLVVLVSADMCCVLLAVCIKQ